MRNSCCRFRLTISPEGGIVESKFHHAFIRYIEIVRGLCAISARATKTTLSNPEYLSNQLLPETAFSAASSVDCAVAQIQIKQSPGRRSNTRRY